MGVERVSALTALLRRPCVSCGAADGVLFQASTHRQDYYCPRCVQEYTLVVTANDQLDAHIRIAVAAWLTAWGHVPGVVDLKEQLGVIGATLAAEHAAGLFPVVSEESDDVPAPIAVALEVKA